MRTIRENSLIGGKVGLMLLGLAFLLSACGQEGQDQKELHSAPIIPKKVQHTLTYSAGDHGSINGVMHQTVEQGADGSEVAAVADDGYHFTSWSDGLGTPIRTDRMISEDLAVTANFTLNQYTLTYTVGNNGSIAGPESQIIDHGADGEPVTAVPTENHHFTTWSDGLNTPTRTDRTVTADLNVTAGFEINYYNLVYEASKHGRIVGDGRQAVSYGKDGSEVTAIADEGSHFTVWSDGLSTPIRTDRAVTADLSVTAGFEENQYTLTYKAGEHGTIEGASEQSIKHGGQSSEIIAIADKGYHFVRWSDGLNTPKRIDSQIAGNLAFSALFAVNTYTVGGTVTGLVEGTQLILQNNAGDDLKITANDEFNFVVELLDAAPYAVTVKSHPLTPNQTCTVTSNTGVIASAKVTEIAVSCVLNTYSIGGKVIGLPDRDRLVLQNNAGDDLLVNANGPFSFAAPLEDGSDYEVKVASPPDKLNWTCDIDNGIGTLSGSDVSDINVNCYVKAVLQPIPGLRKVTLDWNSYDFSNVTFHLCYTQEEISDDESISCQGTQEGTLETKISSPHIVSGLTNDIPYWFRLEVLHADGRRTYSNVVVATAFGGLNDTGVDWCADTIANIQTDGTRSEMIESCYALAGAYPGQDAHFGRDALARDRKLAKTGNGAAGFDFSKVCRSGKVAGERGCSPNPSPGSRRNKWGCTRDNVTGLIWEVKTDSGLHAYDNTYSWFNPDEAVNGETPGVENGGVCQGSSCDTHAFIQKVNELELCGNSDWRLPTRKELLSIVDNSRFKPAIDKLFFPNTVQDYYWTSSSYANQTGFAWQVFFQYGEAAMSEKSQSRHVRLVSGRTMTFGLDNP